MSDIKVRWDNDLMAGDFLFSDNDLTMDDGLATAVLISWFTDQLADGEDEIPNANNDQEFIDKRGWWGDLSEPDVAGDQIGSKLWLLDRAKTNEDNLTTAEDYGAQALQWMLDDEVIKDLEVTAERIQVNGTEVLALKAEIIKADGNKLNLTFDPEWFSTLAE